MKQPSRDQILASIRELTPEEEDICVALEKRMKQLSGYPLRDAIKKHADDMEGMGADLDHAIKDENWLRAAWGVLDIIKDAKKLERALGLNDAAILLAYRHPEETD